MKTGCLILAGGKKQSDGQTEILSENKWNDIFGISGREAWQIRRSVCLS